MSPVLGDAMFYKFSFVLFLIQSEIANVAPMGLPVREVVIDAYPGFAPWACKCRPYRGFGYRLRSLLSDESGGCITSIRANDYVRRGLSTTGVCPRCLLSTPVGIDSARGGFDFTRGGFDFTAVGLTSTENLQLQIEGLLRGWKQCSNSQILERVVSTKSSE